MITLFLIHGLVQIDLQLDMKYEMLMIVLPCRVYQLTRLPILHPRHNHSSQAKALMTLRVFKHSQGPLKIAHHRGLNLRLAVHHLRRPNNLALLTARVPRTLPVAVLHPTLHHLIREANDWITTSVLAKRCDES